jgi:hypothetical protein
LIAVGQLLWMLMATSASPAPMTYEQAVEAFRNVKKGQSRADVVARMGEPAARRGSEWSWDFTKLKGFPGMAPGRQTFTGGVVVFDEKMHVQRSELAWIDVTGPPPKR